jgi:FtsP/CotA-like multicopper oxidase with cupredoxin domain
VEEAALPERQFDLIWGDNVLHHVLPVLHQSLGILARAAKPGALMIFIEPVNLCRTLRRIRFLVPVHTEVTPGERPLEQHDLEIGVALLQTTTTNRGVVMLRFHPGRLGCLVVLMASLVPEYAVSAVQSPQVPFPGADIPQFAQALPLPNRANDGQGIFTVLGNRPLTLHMCEFWANVLPEGTYTPGVQPKTRVWGYIVGDECPPNGPDDEARDSYVGPVIVNQRSSLAEVSEHDSSSCDKPSENVSGRSGSTDVTWVNELGNAATTGVLAYRYSTDQTLHWADPLNKEANVCSKLAEAGVVPAPGSFCAQNYAGSIPAVAHLHGGEVPPPLDGNPEAWFTSNGAFKGPAYYSFTSAQQDDAECDDHDERSHDDPGSRGHRSKPQCRSSNQALYKYPNVQPAAPLWVHDHTLGVTRLSVHAGLAGAYFIEDPSIIPETATTTAGTSGTCKRNCLPDNLPPLAQSVPLVIQDGEFDTNGQFFFPADSAGGVLWNPNPQHPYWASFIGDTILVNGKVWPFLNVEAKRYQFMLLNASNYRAYELSIPNGPPMYVIATDGGYLDEPVRVDTLIMQPGERYEVIIDFAGFTGKNLVIENVAALPFPVGTPPTPSTLGRILQFRVGSPPAGGDASYNPASVPVEPLRTGKNAIVRLADPATGTLAPDVRVQKTRQLTLNWVLQGPTTAIDAVTGLLTNFPGGPLAFLLNNTHYEGVDRPDFTPITIGPAGERITKFVSELPREGDTEVWEVVNLTVEAHPIHLHLVQFQIMNRQNIDIDGYTAVYNASFPGGAYIPEFGPPLSYGPSPASGGTYGGNPDIVRFLLGPSAPPAPYEAGWKDSVIMYPGQVTRIVVRWAPIDIPNTALQAALFYPFDPSNDRGYVWHCHMLDHEDNDLMRPVKVNLNPAAPRPLARPLVQGEEY